MNKELKDLLYSSLCNYFPYGVMIEYPDPFTSVTITEELKEISKLDTGIKINDYGIDIEYVKPLLRQFSDMTKEEAEAYFNACDEDLEILRLSMEKPDIIVTEMGRMSGYEPYRVTEWLYKNHFDFPRKVGDKYLTLIELGLAKNKNNHE